jgi:transposase-like protein
MIPSAVSWETVSKITDQVLEEMTTAWMNRPLDAGFGLDQTRWWWTGNVRGW